MHRTNQWREKYIFSIQWSLDILGFHVDPITIVGQLLLRILPFLNGTGALEHAPELESRLTISLKGRIPMQ